ncbi:tRNA (cytidine(34)-2'-O)-methyltransferase [Gillisia sp. JM1]|uniref:tRNA (cytidine(34)-2'-O)-methyltransferase n=1 Tax=Gillisia sp. JM1 TaxID=1283286 RepID=UPI0004103289|nr:tRNA (cytidine(34)-2'-O)-methyltransferase [Gillisia sp. JM1]
MGYNIVLIEPEIPMNTGNIGRLSLASGSTLHLVKPFGFELNDKRVKRAGLDYWKHISLRIYENVEEFFEMNKDKKMAFFSSHGEKQYWDIDFSDELFLVFGKESVGLSSEIIENNQENLYKIPIYSEHIRSLNLANAVSVVVYEGIRNLKLGS